MRFFLSDSFNRDTPYVQEIIKQFKEYKRTGEASDLIGRDAPLIRPSSAVFAGIRYIHLPDESEAFSIYQHIYHRTSDNFLVYCTGFYDLKDFLLIDILSPNAHDKAENIDLMNRYIKQAEKFREKF